MSRRRCFSAQRADLSCGFRSAADAEELEQFGLTVIDLSQIDDSSSGSHAKFAGSPEVVRLLGAGLNRVGRFGDQGTPSLDQILAGTQIRILGN